MTELVFIFSVDLSAMDFFQDAIRNNTGITLAVCFGAGLSAGLLIRKVAVIPKASVPPQVTSVRVLHAE